MTGEDVKKMTSEEIGIEVARLRERLFTLKSQKTTEKVEDLSQFTKIRRDIARLLTEQSARRAGGASGAPQPGRRPAGSRAARTAVSAGKSAAKPAQKTAARKPAKVASGEAPAKKRAAAPRGRAKAKAKG